MEKNIMINTKLIFVDGITGSGKSTTAHFIARQIEKNDLKVKWFHEEETDHPLTLTKVIEGESDADYVQRNLKEYPQKWIDFVDKVKDDDCIYIMESYLFQDIISTSLEDVDRQTIKDHIHELCSIVACLNPVVIYFHQEDLESALRANWQRRGEVWKNTIVSRDEKRLFCTNRNLSGEIASIKSWQEISTIANELFAELTFPKIQLENSKPDWRNIRKQILDFLQLQMFEELLFDSSFERFCGNYCGYIIQVRDNHLCYTALWPDIKLLPIGKNEFEIDGFPMAIEFIEGENNQINSFKFSKALCYGVEGNVIFKCFELKPEELEIFCGDFWCESDKLARKIYLKEGKLYYWRAENNETELLTINPKKIAFGDGYFDFEFNDGEKKFVLSGPNRDDIVFVEVKKA